MRQLQRYEEDTAEVKRVFVKDECRGKKVATQLMERLEARAKEQGYKQLVLSTVQQ